MPKITVARPFKLNLEDGTVMEFAPGDQNVKKEIADHWYVKANLVGADAELAPAPGSFEYAQSQRRTMAEAQAALDAQSEAAAAAVEEQRRVNEAALMQRTSQAIAQSAVQAEAFAKKDDATDTGAVSDLPNPLAASAPAAAQTDGALGVEGAGELDDAQTNAETVADANVAGEGQTAETKAE